MRGLGLKEVARWNLYYVPHTMGWVITIHQAKENSWRERHSEFLIIYYALVREGLAAAPWKAAMRGLGLKEVARWNLYYVPHTMG